MDGRASDRRKRRPARSIRGLAMGVTVVALLLAVVVQAQRAAHRERKLLDELRAERARAQGLHRLAHLAIDPERLSDAEKGRLRRELDEEAGRFERRAARLRTGTLGEPPP